MAGERKDGVKVVGVSPRRTSCWVWSERELRLEMATRFHAYRTPGRWLPNGSEVGGEDFAVAADDGNAKVEARGGDDAVGHVGDCDAGDLAEGVGDLDCDGNLDKEMVWIIQYRTEEFECG